MRWESIDDRQVEAEEVLGVTAWVEGSLGKAKSQQEFGTIGDDS
jgi:hypothetical protein